MANKPEDELALLPGEDKGLTRVDEYKGCKICNPLHWSHRFLFLFLICFLCFGNYFVYDNPAALQDQFEKVIDESKVFIVCRI